MQDIIDTISAAISANKVSDRSSSLYLGRLGEILFRYTKKFSTEADADTARSEIASILAEVATQVDIPSSFCSGLAGLRWCLHHFEKIGFLTLSPDFFEDIDEIIAEKAVEYCINLNYDFMHGAGGIALALLGNPAVNRDRLEMITDLLLDIRVDFEGYRLWNYNWSIGTDRDKKLISMGLSHGIPSMLVLLTKLYAADIRRASVLEAISECCRFLSTIRNKQQTEDNYSFYPTAVNEGRPSQYTARLGWCYGDLSVAMSLFITGNALDDESLTEHAVSIFDYYALAPIRPEFQLIDAGFCHGSAGVAYLYHKMYKTTQNERYKLTSELYISHLRGQAVHVDGIANFKYYEADNGWQSSTDLLTGVSGIGIALASILNNDTSWDECFLLS